MTATATKAPAKKTVSKAKAATKAPTKKVAAKKAPAKAKTPVKVVSSPIQNALKKRLNNSVFFIA